MAWISVHSQVIGSKLRELAKKVGCPQEYALGVLVALWLWGLDNCDSSGRVLNADKEDILEAFSKKLLGRIDGEKLVESLISTRWLDEPEPGVLFIHDWDTWQEQWYKFQQRKAYDAERKRQERARKQPLKETITEPLEADDHKPESRRSSADRYPNAFETFWQAYPRRIDKGNAYKKYMARLNDGYSEEELLSAAVSYAKMCRNEKTETKFIKHPKTFLSDSMPFLDYLETVNVAASEAKENLSENDNPFDEFKRDD